MIQTVTDKFYIHDTKIFFRNNTEKDFEDDWLKHKFRHYGYFYQILNMLAADGFDVQADPDVDKIIRKDHYIGKFHELEFEAKKYPNGFEIGFFQNVVYENPNGGRHDFDKLSKMPHMTRLRYTKFKNKILRLLGSLVPDIYDDSTLSPKLAEEWIKCRYVESCHHEQKNTDFDLRSLDGQTQEPYNGLDRDKKTIRNGEIKYFRGRNGYLYRGRVYHDLNNMWWVIINKFEVKRVAAFELFDLAPGDKRGRNAPLRIPPESISRKQAVSQSATKELVAELRKRGLKVKIQ